MNERILTVTLVDNPRSTDPLDYDYSIHHNVMRSVYASLVSVYKTGEIFPQIAKSWKVNSDHTLWELELNKEWTFQNGEKVTPEIVVSNFKRVLLVKNRLKSESGLLEYLIDSNKINSLSDEIEGIKIRDNSVLFHFVKSMPDFLSKISFGIYGIAHPLDYNIDGTWKDKKKINSSGIYFIKSWNDEYFQIMKEQLIKLNLFFQKINQIF
jgi:ABC-type transport system substrate-binding protein